MDIDFLSCGQTIAAIFPFIVFFCHLAILSLLQLHDNEISSLPSAIGELEQLQKLNLRWECLFLW